MKKIRTKLEEMLERIPEYRKKYMATAKVPTKTKKAVK